MKESSSVRRRAGLVVVLEGIVRAEVVGVEATPVRGDHGLGVVAIDGHHSAAIDNPSQQKEAHEVIHKQHLLGARARPEATLWLCESDRASGGGVGRDRREKRI